MLTTDKESSLRSFAWRWETVAHTGIPYGSAKRSGLAEVTRGFRAANDYDTTIVPSVHLLSGLPFGRGELVSCSIFLTRS